MRDRILWERNEDRRTVTNALKKRFHKMVKTYGKDFPYDFAICMILYMKEKNKPALYQKMSRSGDPKEIFLITIIGCISRFSVTEAEASDMIYIFFDWVTREFPRDHYEKLKEEERENLGIFDKPPTVVH